jgi:chromosomal replication initiator protein
MEVLEDPGHRYNPLIVHGGSGVGKTHLLRALEHELRARKRPGRPEGDPCPFYRVIYVRAEEFFNQYAASVQDGTVRRFREKYRSQDVLILDDVQLLVDKKKTQIEFLHTFSSLFESGRQIILGSDVPPKALRMLDASLVCRLMGGLAVEIRKPDFETRLGIARNHAARLPDGIDDAAIELVARNVRRGARDIEGAMLELRLHAGPGERITAERASAILAGILEEAGARVDLPRIVRAVAFHFGIAEEALVSKSRERHVAFARQVAVHLARLYTRKSRPEIGKYFGKRDPSTVKSAEKKIEKLLRSPGGDFTREIEAIKARIED